MRLQDHRGWNNMEPFRVDVPDEVLNDLQTRLKLTRWADDFANESWQYGTNTAYLKELVSYWIERYDWRRQERAVQKCSPARA
jgi:microsomal epoxide hydrolase